MTATGQNFTIYQGDHKQVYVTTYEEDGITNLNILSCDINWVMYKRYPENIVLTKTTASGITITTAASGIFLISLVPVDTENLLGEYNHEAELTDQAGNISTIMVGKVDVYKSKA